MSWSSGTNTIKEGSESKNLTLQMLEVKKQGGGTELFVRKADVSLGTKSVNQNGTYTAAADSKYGFSQFSVNVRGGNGSADSSGKPTGGDIKPGGAGSAVVGTDPETGNDVVVGVDENDNLVNTPVPSGIEIVTPPTKTDYVYQEDMDYSGLVVKMINRDGTTFTDVGHPNGYLAVGELVLPVEKAPAASGEAGRESSLINRPVPCAETGKVYFSSSSSYFDVYFSSGSGLLTTFSLYTDKGWSALFASDDSSAYYHFIIDDQVNQNYTYDGKTVYYARSDLLSGNSGTPMFDRDKETMEAIAWTMIYGTPTGGTATIPVRWTNPYTGATHQDTFEITSTPADGDAHTSTGSSGTEGSGGGGSF